uniref:Uncharacterized protein n=1 Tax=Oryza brachyantha TaxID=4533 RepID=J3L6T3_ORYBR
RPRRRRHRPGPGRRSRRARQGDGLRGPAARRRIAVARRGHDTNGRLGADTWANLSS